jgi:hypothetical protein
MEADPCKSAQPMSDEEDWEPSEGSESSSGEVWRKGEKEKKATERAGFLGRRHGGMAERGPGSEEAKEGRRKTGS